MLFCSIDTSKINLSYILTKSRMHKISLIASVQSSCAMKTYLKNILLRNNATTCFYRIIIAQSEYSTYVPYNWFFIRARKFKPGTGLIDSDTIGWLSWFNLKSFFRNCLPYCTTSMVCTFRNDRCGSSCYYQDWLTDSTRLTRLIVHVGSVVVWRRMQGGIRFRLYLLCVQEVKRVPGGHVPTSDDVFHRPSSNF